MLESIGRWLGAAPRVDEHRWVVLDVESSGLDPKRDRLLAVAAVGVHFDAGRPRIHLGDSFEQVLRQSDAHSMPDKANILLHGIGVGTQRAGVPPAQALVALEAFVGRSPLVAFHAAFDQALIDRACRSALGRRLHNRWLDLEPLAAVLHPTVQARALDEWMAHLGIRCPVRHQAAADTLATAELMLMLWPALQRQLDRPSFHAVAALAAQRRWIAQ